MNSEKYEVLVRKLAQWAEENNFIEPDLYKKYGVKRGLRNDNGTGVLVGLTRIAGVYGYKLVEGKKVGEEGNLEYRGIKLKKLVRGFQSEGRYGFEETSYLLLFGKLPNRQELEEFNALLGARRKLPKGFIENQILKNPSKDIMNKIQRSTLVSYSFDENPDDISVFNIIKQSIDMIAKFPTMMAYGYQAKAHYFDEESLYIHVPKPEYSTAENILHMIRPDNQFTPKEAELLDLCLVIHAEHGGGNNSAFATYVVSSSGTDTYSALAAAVGSLKGPKHGGANKKVLEMMEDIKNNLSSWKDDDEIREYLRKILKKEAFDGSGLIYGMGHAIYTLSDPRAILLKEKAYELAEEKDLCDVFNLYSKVEELAKEVFYEMKGPDFPIAANVDFYSGFVYQMMDIPKDLYTPIFAVARVAGWCAHRVEQLISEQKIIRPAYKAIGRQNKYIPLSERK